MVSRTRDIAPGPDGIGYGAGRCGGGWVVDVLHSCFQSWGADGHPLPESFNWAMLALVPKKDEPALRPEDTRPLSLSNTDCKLFAAWLQSLVSSVLEEHVTPDQFVFMPTGPSSRRSWS